MATTTTDTKSETGVEPAELGLERRVQFAFVLGAAVAAWLLDKIVTALWDRFGSTEPDPKIVTLLAVLAGGVGAWAAYRKEGVRQWSMEVASELARVVWPGRQETWQLTLVVLVVSFISAALLGVFDAIWAALTSVVY